MLKFFLNLLNELGKEGKEIKRDKYNNTRARMLESYNIKMTLKSIYTAVKRFNFVILYTTLL